MFGKREALAYLVRRFEHAKANLSTEKYSPKAELRVSGQDVDARWKASTQSEAP